jgi:hypothetical protein
MQIDPNRPNIRLPDDPGPNPYDSRTKVGERFEHNWLTSLGWWIGILVLAGGYMLMRHISG